MPRGTLLTDAAALAGVAVGELTGCAPGETGGATALEVIARDAAKRFPEVFPDWKDALTRAGELSVQYGR